MWTASTQDQKQQDQLNLDQNLQNCEPNNAVLDVCYVESWPPQIRR